MPRFTPKQGQYLAFIATYTQMHGRPPAETDIQRYFRVSPPSVHQMILTLEARGLISREPRTARSVRVLVDADDLPTLGSVKAGAPLAAPGMPPSLAERYPCVAHWVAERGWIEVGADYSRRSMVRALDEGGMVWEGQEDYPTLDALFADLERHLAAVLAPG